MTILGLSIAEASVIVAAIIAIVGGFIRLQMQATQNTKDALDALRVALEVREEVNKMRLETAEKYASIAHLKEVEGRLAVAIDRLTDRIDKILSILNKS